MITIYNFVFNSFAVNSFVLSDGTGEAVLIDAACSSGAELNQVAKYLADNNLTLRLIANTHGHVDHVAGVHLVKERFEVPFFISDFEQPLLNNAMQFGDLFGFDLPANPVPDGMLHEGEPLRFGQSELKILHVPGHSPGSVVFYSEADRFLIVGDVLFSGSIGRTDLPGGNHEQLLSGIRTKLFTLDPECIVYPGHGPSTTIGSEMRTNPFFS